jgi:hypothetical protein
MWSCLKLITVGFSSYSVDLKVSRLVKCKLKYIYLFVTEFARHAMYIQRHIQAFLLKHF